jgi:hypothetical protein
MIAGVAALLAGCGSAAGPAEDQTRPSVCADMDNVATVWTAQAPPELFGDAQALAAFTDGLLEVLDEALDGLRAEAPDGVVADTVAVAEALGRYYSTARAYAAGDIESVPSLLPEDRAALGRLADWAETRCPGERW